MGCTIRDGLLYGNFYNYTPTKQMFSGDILKSACLSDHGSVCVQNTTFCQSAGWGIKSHSVTALILNDKCLLSITCVQI